MSSKKTVELFTVNEAGQYVCSFPGCGVSFGFGQEGALEQHLKTHKKQGAQPGPKQWKDMGKKEKLAALIAADKRMKTSREKAENAEVKSLSQIALDQDKVLKAYVKELDCTILFKKMNVEQFLSLPDNDKEAAYHMTYYQLHNADPTVTKEQIWSMHFDVVDCILKGIGEANYFLNLPSYEDLQKELQDNSLNES